MNTRHKDHFESFALAGASVAVVKDGEVVFAKGYGFADVAAGVPANASFSPQARSIGRWTFIKEENP